MVFFIYLVFKLLYFCGVLADPVLFGHHLYHIHIVVKLIEIPVH